MWSVIPIIVVAIVGALVFFVAGATLAITFSRRQHRQILRRRGALPQSVSANETSYANALRMDLRHSGADNIPAIWNSLPSEERIQTEGNSATAVENETSPPNAKRRKTLRSSLRGSIRIPKTRRHRKIGQSISLSRMPRSPLSAITEFTDTSNDETSIATFPVVPSPGIPETNGQIPNHPQQAIHPRRVRSDEHPNDIVSDRPVFVRSTSMTGTISDAPIDPLPPLPVFNPYKQDRDARWRTSTVSLDTVGSSVLGTVISSPSRADMDNSLNSGMQSFEFGFDGHSSARLGIPPSKQTLLHKTSSGITSIRPTVEWQTRTDLSGVSGDPKFHNADSLKAIEGSNWIDSLQHIHQNAIGNRMRHSLQDYNSILSRGQQRTTLPRSDESLSQQVPRRPASIASGNPYQRNQKPALAVNRSSIKSTDSAKKGHKRQNCVRITNLPMVDFRLVREMPEVVEEPFESSEDDPQVPGQNLLEAGKPALRVRASLVDVKGSPSPLRNRPILLPTTRTDSCQTSARSSMLFRPDSDVFSNTAASTPEVFVTSAPKWPLSPTSPTHIKLNANTDVSQRNSPILPSPVNSASFRSRVSQVKGPRDLPRSGRSSRHASPSPAAGKYSRPTTDELRKSVMMLRSMNSEGRLLDQNSRMYRSIGEDTTVFPSFGNLNGALFPMEKRVGSINVGRSRSKMGLAMSPSAMSTGAASIWEDASVRADSPEPDLLVPKPLEIQQPRPQTPKMNVRFPELEEYENFVSPGSKLWSTWTSAKSPESKRVGMHIDNAILATPRSLYDRDGFLKD